MRDLAIDWAQFLGRPAAGIDPEIAEEFVRGKRILLTGAGGSIGSALAYGLAVAGADRLVLLDIAEHGLFELGNELPGVEKELVVGDVCNAALLREIFAEHRPHVVFHAAACKHVSLMEANPFTAARSNILGTQRLLMAANEGRADQVIVISTDKAVEPAGIMGATKRVGEMLVLASTGSTRVKAVRLANVLGSSGSVVPTFVRQIAEGGPLTFTDPNCTRYFLSMDEAVGFLVSALAVDAASTVLVPESGEPFSVPALAQFLMGHSPQAERSKEIVYTGLRSGEKLAEKMVSSDESVTPSNVPGLKQAVSFHAVSASILTDSIKLIEAAIEERNVESVMRAIVALLPAYEPSRQIRTQAGREVKQ